MVGFLISNDFKDNDDCSQLHVIFLAGVVWPHSDWLAQWQSSEGFKR